MDLAWWIAVIAVPLVGCIFYVDGLIHSKAQTALDEQRTVSDAASNDLHVRIDTLQKELSDYKVSAAMLFAQVTMTREIKDDIGKVLSRIEDRLTGIETDLRGRK